jgi:hypothetical protein
LRERCYPHTPTPPRQGTGPAREARTTLSSGSIDTRTARDHRTGAHGCDLATAPRLTHQNFGKAHR